MNRQERRLEIGKLAREIKKHQLGNMTAKEVIIMQSRIKRLQSAGVIATPKKRKFLARIRQLFGNFLASFRQRKISGSNF